MLKFTLILGAALLVAFVVCWVIAALGEFLEDEGRREHRGE